MIRQLMSFRFPFYFKWKHRVVEFSGTNHVSSFCNQFIFILVYRKQKNFYSLEVVFRMIVLYYYQQEECTFRFRYPIVTPDSFPNGVSEVRHCCVGKMIPVNFFVSKSLSTDFLSEVFRKSPVDNDLFFFFLN